jgi:hypothetical protein
MPSNAFKNNILQVYGSIAVLLWIISSKFVLPWCYFVQILTHLSPMVRLFAWQPTKSPSIRSRAFRRYIKAIYIASQTGTNASPLAVFTMSSAQSEEFCLFVDRLDLVDGFTVSLECMLFWPNGLLHPFAKKTLLKVNLRRGVYWGNFVSASRRLVQQWRLSAYFDSYHLTCE